MSLQAGSLESGEHSLVFTAPEAVCTATATHIDVCKKLDMVGCTIISVSPDRPNIYYYEVFDRTEVLTCIQICTFTSC